MYNFPIFLGLKSPQALSEKDGKMAKPYDIW
jgi:hypothetical protein